MSDKLKYTSVSKVVHLDQNGDTVSRARLSRLPSVVKAVHEKGNFLLSGHVSRFFDKVDDALFELADKAGSNREQNIYFDAMREIRVQRSGIEKAFIYAVEDAYVNLIEPGGAREKPDAELTDNTLSILSHEDLEEIVAVESTVSRATREHSVAIQHMSLRLDSQVPIKVFQDNNPLGPQVLCSAFTAQIKGMDVDIKVKLVLFKLFDREVIGKLGELYHQVNKLLVDHNILPSIGAHGTDPITSQVQSSALEGAKSAATLQNSTAITTGLQQLFGDKFVSQASSAAESTVGNELLGLLSLAQKMPAQGSLAADLTGPGEPVVTDIRALIGELQRQSGIQARVEKLDEEVINLVSMLFEFVLQDRNLPLPMKALISRLQIPIVKVALADKTFFTQGGHSARRLLNDIATAALGWQGEDGDQGDPLYSKIASIVDSLLHDFDADIGIFTDLLTDFTAFTEKERRRSAIMERRTVAAEDGKARAELARTTVTLELDLRIQDRAIPKVVMQLINEAWSNVLFVVGLKHGLQSQEWEQALTTLDDLLWSVTSMHEGTNRRTLIKMVPDLLKRLRAGFDTISFNPYEMAGIFKALEDIHLRGIRGVALTEDHMAPMVCTPVRQEDEKPTMQADDAQNRDQASQPAPFGSAPAQQAEGLHQESAFGSVLSENDSPANDGPENASPENDSENDSPENDSAMHQVENFAQGSWFELKLDEDTFTRCRLAAFIRPTGKYIFVNRIGMKVAEKTQRELAAAFEKGHVRVLDNSMLFDRALETVVTGLRKNN